MNLTIIQLLLIRSSHNTLPKLYHAGFYLSLSTKSHNLNILNSRFSYFTSELIKIPLNSANLLLLNSKFDHFLAPSLTISSKSYSVTNKTYSDRINFPSSTTKIKFKDCIWSNFFSTSDKGGCFGIQGISEATISGCSFINIITYTKHSVGKGAFMIIIDDPDDPEDFSFKNNIMINISSTNNMNTPYYHAFYVTNKGSSKYSTNSMNLLSKGGTYSSLLQTLSSTSISYSNFTNCNCKIGSGMNVEFFDKSSVKIRYSLYSNLGGQKLLRLSPSIEAISGPTSNSDSQPKSAKITIDSVSFLDNDGPLLIALNNNIAKDSDHHFDSNFGIRFSLTSSQFFGNKNMTYPIYAKVPKLNVLTINDFDDCVSDSKLIIQPELNDVYSYMFQNGWHVFPRPTKKPPKPTEIVTPAQTPEITETPNETLTSTPEISMLPDQTSTQTPDQTTEIVIITPTEIDVPTIEPTYEDRVDIVKEGEIFTTNEKTSSLLIEGVATINIENLQDLQFSSYNSSTESSEINLIGKGLEQVEENDQNYELKVKDFNNVTINVYNSLKRDKSDDSDISLPIVVSEVSNFEINNGYGQNENEINIKTINAPTKTKDFTSQISSNSKLNIKLISFSSDNSNKRLHQTVVSHSKFASNVDAIFLNENIDAELVNFTVKDQINIIQNSRLKLKQTKVNYRTIIEFDVNSLNEVGQIQLDELKSLDSMYYNYYSFTPNKIKFKINDNSLVDKKMSIIDGINEDNCKQMFVSFQPQTNLKGSPYRSSCEDNQLFISVQSDSNKNKKSKKLNYGIIAIAVFGGVILIVIIVAVACFLSRKSRKTIIDPSDAFEVSMGNNNNPNAIYN